MSTHQEITYYSDGLKIAAHLHLPEESVPDGHPAVILVHGYSGLKEVFGSLPQRLRDAGYAVLAIDNRGYNLSEGRGQRSNPEEHSQDVFDAITYLETRPEIDRERIGIFGTSWGGGIAISAAARDPRLKVVATAVAVTDGERWLREVRTPEAWEAFGVRLAEAARERVVEGTVPRAPLSEMMISDPHSKEVSSKISAGNPRFSPSYELESAEWCSRWHPVWIAGHIAPRPVLTISADADALVPPSQQIALHEACGEPKRFVNLPGAQHYDSYEIADPDSFEIVVRESLAWFETHLASLRVADSVSAS